MTDTINGVPALGLGTWGRTGEAGMRAMLDAMEVGYRHFDTAQSYGTEAPLGEAIARSGLKRSDLFVTTKVASTNLARERVLASVQESLANLRVDCIDLLLIHWPSAGDAVPLADYLEPLAEAKAKGLAARIGVSNFTIAHLARANKLLGPGALACNQFETHPFLQSRTLRDYCRTAGIAVTAYSPIAKGRVAEDPVIRSIAVGHGATPAQVALAFLLGEGLICIPASGRRERMAENLAAAGLKLTAADMRRMRALDRGERLIDPPTAPVWDR